MEKNNYQIKPFLKKGVENISEVVKALLPGSNTYQAYNNLSKTEFGVKSSAIIDTAGFLAYTAVGSSFIERNNSDLDGYLIALGLGATGLKLISYFADKKAIKKNNEMYKTIDNTLS